MLSLNYYAIFVSFLFIIIEEFIIKYEFKLMNVQSVILQIMG